MRSGIIDVDMYEMLLRADLVVADISTGNANAIYELGVRHALKPRSTIVMKENQGLLQFDLDPRRHSEAQRPALSGARAEPERREGPGVALRSGAGGLKLEHVPAKIPGIAYI